MGKRADGLRITRVSARSRSSRLSGSNGGWASVLHPRWIMEALTLTAAMMLSGLLAIGGTRVVLGVVLLAFTRDAASR